MNWNAKSKRFTGPVGQCDIKVGDGVARKAGFAPVRVTSTGVEIAPVDGVVPSDLLVAMFPGLIMVSRGGRLTLVPPKEVQAEEGGQDLSWVRGTCLIVAQVEAMGSIYRHLLFVRVGHLKGTEGGFAISAPSMERLGNQALETGMLDAARAVASHFWEHGATFNCSLAGLQETVSDLAGLLGQPISLNIKGLETAGSMGWVGEDGETIQVAAKDKKIRGGAGPLGVIGTGSTAADQAAAIIAASRR